MALWDNDKSVEDWWTKVALKRAKEREAMASIIMLISWVI
jgi:hypothetical protein